MQWIAEGIIELCLSEYASQVGHKKKKMARRKCAWTTERSIE